MFEVAADSENDWDRTPWHAQLPFEDISLAFKEGPLLTVHLGFEFLAPSYYAFRVEVIVDPPTLTSAHSEGRIEEEMESSESPPVDQEAGERNGESDRNPDHTVSTDNPEDVQSPGEDRSGSTDGCVG